MTSSAISKPINPTFNIEAPPEIDFGPELEGIGMPFGTKPFIPDWRIIIGARYGGFNGHNKNTQFLVGAETQVSQLTNPVLNPIHTATGMITARIPLHGNGAPSLAAETGIPKNYLDQIAHARTKSNVNLEFLMRLPAGLFTLSPSDFENVDPLGSGFNGYTEWMQKFNTQRVGLTFMYKFLGSSSLATGSRANRSLEDGIFDTASNNGAGWRTGYVNVGVFHDLITVGSSAVNDAGPAFQLRLELGFAGSRARKPSNGIPNSGGANTGGEVYGLLEVDITKDRLNKVGDIFTLALSNDVHLDVTEYVGALPADLSSDLPQTKLDDSITVINLDDAGDQAFETLRGLIPEEHWQTAEQYSEQALSIATTAGAIAPYADDAVRTAQIANAGVQIARAGQAANITKIVGRTGLGMLAAEIAGDYIEDNYLSDAAMERMVTGSVTPTTQLYSDLKDNLTADELGLVDIISTPMSEAMMLDMAVKNGTYSYAEALEAVDRLAATPGLDDEAQGIIDHSVGLRYLKALENFATQNGFPDGVESADVSEIAEHLYQKHCGSDQLAHVMAELETKFGLIRLPEDGDQAQWWLSGVDIDQGKGSAVKDQYLNLVDHVASLWRDDKDQANVQAKRAQQKIESYGAALGVNIQPTIFDTYTGPSNKPKGPIAEKQ